MLPAAASCWRLLAPLPIHQQAEALDLLSPRSRRRSRACSARSIWASIRRSRRRTSSLDLNYDDVAAHRHSGRSLSCRSRAHHLLSVRASRPRKTLHLAIVPDSHPGAGHYYRSDHFSFARVGVPGFSIDEGQTFHGHDRQWGEAAGEGLQREALSPAVRRYRPDMDFRGDALMAKFGIALGWQAATQPEKIEWLAGDEFEKPRKASEK